jgi:hypothetical protein
MIEATPNGDRKVSGFPAGSLPGLRFLPDVVPKSMIALGFSTRGEPRKFFYPEFSRAAGNRRSGAAWPVSAPSGDAANHRLATRGPITPRVVAVQPAPLRRRGALSARFG